MIDSLTKLYNKDGFFIVKDFFKKNEIKLLLLSIKKIYINQFKFLGYPYYNDNGSFDLCIKRLFREEFDIFTNCGKHVQQGNVELYKLALDNNLLNLIKRVGISDPHMATRPVVMQNSKFLAKQSYHYKTPAHIDWESIRGSQDCMVVWVPLMDIPKNLGPVCFLPGTHNHEEEITFKSIGGFMSIGEEALVDQYGPYEQPEVELGDIVLFSSKLIHKSGDILNDDIRWSCHFRYNNIEDRDFIERGYEFNYLYLPKTKLEE